MSQRTYSGNKNEGRDGSAALIVITDVVVRDFQATPFRFVRRPVGT